MRFGTAWGVGLTGLALAWLVGRLPGCRHRRRDGEAVVVLTALTWLFFWPVWLAGYVFPKGGGDLWGQLYPVWTFVARQVRHGAVPLWDPLLMAGDPIVSEAQYGLFNPLNWTLFLVSPPPEWLVLWRGMVNVLLAGVGTYLFLTRSPDLRLRRSPGLLGAIAYMFADPFVVHLGHPQINDAMAWLPWSLLALDWTLAGRSWRRVPPAGLPVALLVLSGHGQMALYGLMTLALYGLWRSRTTIWRAWLAQLARLALVAAVAFALAAPMLLPAIERMPWTTRSLVPDEERRGYEFFPALLADSLAPNIHGRGADGWWPAADRVETGYAGAVTLLLAILGLAAQRRRAAFWVLLGGLSVAFALGYQAPLYPQVAHLPFFTDLWKTARAIYLLAFSVAVLGALGLHSLIESRSRKLQRLWLGGLVVGGLGLAVVAPHLLGSLPDGQPYQKALANLQLVSWLALGLAGLAWRWRRASAGIVLLLAAEMTALGALPEMDASPSLAAAAASPEHAAVLEFLQNDPGWFRVDTQGRARHLLSPEILQVHGFETLQGSGNPLSLWPFEQFYWTQPTKDAPGYRLLGAKYILVPKGDPPPGEGIWPVFTTDAQVDVHLHTGALPRAWLVYRTEPAADYAAAWRRVLSPDFAPETIAFVEDGPELNGQGSGRIEVLGYGPNEARFAVETDTTALLVLSDVFYPGWQADVDGERARVYRTDATFRGVVVPPGRHEVRMRFQPHSLWAGLGLASLGLLSVLLAVVGKRRGST